MIEHILEWDTAIILWVQSIRCAPISSIMIFITRLGDAGAVWLIISIAMLLFRKTRKTGIVMLASIAVNFLLNDLLIKNLVQRQRPYEAIEMLTSLVGEERSFSFPSGHSCISFGAAGAMWNFNRDKAGAIALCGAALIALSRLYVGVHYLTDIMAGAVLGFGVSILVVWIFKRFIFKETAVQ